MLILNFFSEVRHYFCSSIYQQIFCLLFPFVLSRFVHTDKHTYSLDKRELLRRLSFEKYEELLLVVLYENNTIIMFFVNTPTVYFGQLHILNTGNGYK
jgi:hypothetical protein